MEPRNLVVVVCGCGVQELASGLKAEEFEQLMGTQRQSSKQQT